MIQSIFSYSQKRFAGKNAVITGAGSGTGRAAAYRLSAEGAGVALLDVNIEGAAETRDVICRSGGSARFYQADVSDGGNVRDAIRMAIADFSKIDVLINSAGIDFYKQPADYCDEEWLLILGINLTGTWNTCRSLIPHFIENRRGAIVNVSSGGSTSSYMRAPCVASKGGVSALTRALALDLGDYGIRVNAVSPECTKTNMTKAAFLRPGSVSESMIHASIPLRRWGTPEESAAAIAFLASDDASFITGEELRVDGGLNAGNQIGAAWTTAFTFPREVSYE